MNYNIYQMTIIFDKKRRELVQFKRTKNILLLYDHFHFDIVFVKVIIFTVRCVKKQTLRIVTHFLISQ